MGGIVSRLCGEIKLPRMLKVKQHFDPSCIKKDDIPKAVFDELSKPELADAIKPGMRIAVTCGSRGVANIAVITKAITDYVKSKGAHPFVVPAMGSHGGASAEGQKALLASYGVTEESAGCPIHSSMETVSLGKTKDPVYEVRLDKHAAQADGIIAAGRIKPHTDFHGEYESGIMKMLAIGLGKREGADICHQFGFGRMAEMVLLFGKAIIENAPVIMGFGIMENAYSQTYKLAAMPASEIEKREPLLLKEARSRLPFLPFENCDVLVVDRFGKDISGLGMDPNITGASPCTPFVKSCFSANRTVVLDLTRETHGTAMGIGAADVITKRLFDKIDFEASYVNAITSRGIDYVRIPLIADNDRESIQTALRTCIGIDKDNPRIIRITDSVHTETFYISEVLKDEAVKKNLDILERAAGWKFNEEGNLWRDV